MGKKIRVQRRGRGTTTFRATTHKRVAPAHYLSFTEIRKEPAVAIIEKFIHEPGRGTPIAQIRLEEGNVYYNVVPEGVSAGQKILIGTGTPIETGNILALGEIPSGAIICDVEITPGDGGKIARSSGTYATVVAHTPDGTFVKLPSGKSIYLKDSCRATIGVISGAGRTNRPFLKAGKKAALMDAKGRVYPISKGVAMNPVAHPHGGGSHKSSSMRPTTISRRAPSGQKVGLIAARRSGIKRRSRIE